MNSYSKKNKDLLSVLKNRVLLCDGAMGTMLQSYGLSGPTDLFNLDDKALKIITDIHLGYLEAGADILLTNTLGSSKLKLNLLGFEKDIEEINGNALNALKNAIGIYREKSQSNRDIFIAGDVGPSGKLLEPYGDIKLNDAVSSFRAQIEVLLENGADFILIETIIDLNEALAAVKAARDIDPEVAVACTLSFKEDGVTVMGNRAEEFGSILLDSGCDIIGANCSVGSDTMIDITKKIRNANPEARLLIQPNAGLPEIDNGMTVFNETPEIMVKNFKEILKYKPSIVGTCCGSTPDHTRKIAELLHEM
jgi:5-methyltetrahydrofolate--homocysteine methyltransferase